MPEHPHSSALPHGAHGAHGAYGAHAHHGHHHHHHHHRPDSPAARRVLLLAIVLNLGFVIAEFIAGWYAHSTALIADAGHNLSDVLGLIMALAAIMLHRREISARFTYGFRSSSILAALANAMLLLLSCGAIAWEAMQRLLAPAAVDGQIVAAVATAGIVINGLSAWLMHRQSGNDLNLRAAVAHLALDAAVSLAVVIGGMFVDLTGWNRIDSALSFAIVLLVLFSTWGLLQEALRLALSAVPAHIDPEAVRHFLLSQPGVTAVDDLHIWGMSTTETALTAHLVMPGSSGGDRFLNTLSSALEHQFHIHHVTLQVMTERPPTGCVLLRP